VADRPAVRRSGVAEPKDPGWPAPTRYPHAPGAPTRDRCYGADSAPV